MCLSVRHGEHHDCVVFFPPLPHRAGWGYYRTGGFTPFGARFCAVARALKNSLISRFDSRV